MAPAPFRAYHYRFVSGQTPGMCPAAMPTRRPCGMNPPPVTPCRRGTASAIPGQRSRPSRKDRTGPHGTCPRLPLQTRTGRPPVAPPAIRPLAGRVVPAPGAVAAPAVPVAPALPAEAAPEAFCAPANTARIFSGLFSRSFSLASLMLSAPLRSSSKPALARPLPSSRVECSVPPNRHAGG